MTWQQRNIQSKMCSHLVKKGCVLHDKYKGKLTVNFNSLKSSQVCPQNPITSPQPPPPNRTTKKPLKMSLLKFNITLIFFI